MLATADEFQKAEKLWIIFTQRDIVKQGNYKQLKKELNLQVEDKIIRCIGRLKNAPLSYDARFPILLPKNNAFSDLIIKHCHQNVLHNGMKETVNELRNRFWITKARNDIKKIIHKCFICKRFEGKPYKYPEAPDLPKFRLTKDFPFTYTGLDYAGPVYVKNIYGSNEMFKAWIFLYTCATTRGIYLDLVPDCSSSTCIRGLKRFISNRGTPKLIVSDNGSQFVSSETQGYVAGKGIKWKPNLAAAPWWGGIFERMVRSTKRCLKKILGDSRLTYEEVLTILSEIQVRINNRRLTFLYEEPGDEVVTPNRLLFGRKLNLDCHGNDACFNENVNSRFSHLSSILKHFWKRWIFEYLTEL